MPRLYSNAFAADLTGVSLPKIKNWREALEPLVHKFGDKGLTSAQLLGIKVVDYICKEYNFSVSRLSPAAESIFAACRAQPHYLYPAKDLWVDLERGTSLALRDAGPAMTPPGLLAVPIRDLARELHDEMHAMETGEVGGRKMVRVSVAALIAGLIIGLLMFHFAASAWFHKGTKDDGTANVAQIATRGLAKPCMTHKDQYHHVHSGSREIGMGPKIAIRLD